MADDDGDHGEADAPEQLVSHKGSGVAGEFFSDVLVSVDDVLDAKLDAALLKKYPDASDKTPEARKRGGKSCSCSSHGREAEQTEDEDAVKYDVEDDHGDAYGCALADKSSVLEDGLEKPGQAHE